MSENKRSNVINTQNKGGNSIGFHCSFFHNRDLWGTPKSDYEYGEVGVEIIIAPKKFLDNYNFILRNN
jgi:hypothetical protein